MSECRILGFRPALLDFNGAARRVRNKHRSSIIGPTNLRDRCLAYVQNFFLKSSKFGSRDKVTFAMLLSYAER
jgi:hypothetical protein